MKGEALLAGATYRIEPMSLADIDAVLGIEALSFSNPWPREAFEYEVDQNAVSHPLVARHCPEGRLVGYCIYWLVSDQVHIQNLAVDPHHRRRGLGRFLLRYALTQAARLGALSAMLEVRESNRLAQELYRSMGFQPVGMRKNYYSFPREDAILLSKAPLDED